jgi:hypothetical protein
MVNGIVMSKIDNELNRLIKYAESLDVKVLFPKYKRGYGAADWSWIDQTINVYVHSKNTKIGLLFSLLHELGHHLDWIYKKKRIPSNVYLAYNKLVDGHMDGFRTDLDKNTRRIILQEELDGIHYMEFIFKELDLKVPYWKLKLQQKLDIYDYKMLYKKGRFSTTAEFEKYKKRVKTFCKKKYGGV